MFTYIANHKCYSTKLLPLHVYFEKIIFLKTFPLRILSSRIYLRDALLAFACIVMLEFIIIFINW